MMLPQILAILAALVLVLAAIAVVLMLGMRAKASFARGFFIWFTRTVANPMAMKTAGTPGASASVIRCCGRKSGRTFETPVGAVPIDGGFVIALPYGSNANWLRNVLANKSATIVHEGREYSVDRPELVPMRTVEHFFGPSDRRGFRVFGVDECLRVSLAQPG